MRKLSLKILLLAFVLPLLSVFTQPVFSADAETITNPKTTIIPQLGDIKSKEGVDFADKFRMGQFELYDLGTYARYLIETLIIFAGGIAVLFIIIGGYKYMIGSISDDKEAGKKTIGYALAGFAVAVLAWTIINFVQVWLTSGV
ncbi:MAG: pilin [Patescibacteria group bacterium]